MFTAAQGASAKRHIQRLADKHHVEVHFCKTWKTAECEQTTRQAFVPKRIRTGIDYLASLHELGHLVDPVALDSSASFCGTTHRKERSYRRTIEEAAAWAWAVQHASPTLLKACNDYDWSSVGWAWSSYAAKS